MNESNKQAVSQVGDTICCARDEALRLQLERTRATLEARSSDEEAYLTQKSLFQVLRECIPSDSPLTSFLDNRSHTTTTRTSLISHGGYARHSIGTPGDAWTVIDEKGPSKNHVLILRDIDSDSCEALCARYPDSIDRRFILEHILGLDLQLYPGSLYQAPYDSRSPLKERMVGARIAATGLLAGKMQLMEYVNDLRYHEFMAIMESEDRAAGFAVEPTLRADDLLVEGLAAFPMEDVDTSNDVAESDLHALFGRRLNWMQEHLLAVAARIDSKTQKARGIHVNWWRAPQSEDHGYQASDSHEEFRKTKKCWTKSNAFVSCCRLADNLYLVLTSTTPSMRDDAKTMGPDRVICIAPNFGSRVIACVPDHDRENLIDDAVADLIQQNWPFFDYSCRSETELSAWAQSQADGLVFASLLKESVLRMGVEREEGEMRDLAYLAASDDDAGHFKRLTEFRRVLASLYQALGEVKNAFKISAKAELLGRGLVLLCSTKQPAAFAPGGAVEDLTEPQHSADFNKAHMQSLQELQERLDAIKEDLNEEIQLAIGSVQVHDAQTMKKQTTWTVVLTVLAAIYLPMTLVTGIFGMNITEISSEATAPDAWWAFGAWAVVFAVTLGGILLYAVVRKWKARNKRKKKADLEANYMSTVFTGRVRRRAGGKSDKGVKTWARNLRRKTKKTWSSKRE